MIAAASSDIERGALVDESAPSLYTEGLLPQITSIRAINRARIVSLIRRRPGLSRTELSRLTQLSKGTISKLVAELLEEGFLYEHHGERKRQRNTGLYLNRNAGLAVGLELSPGECRGMLTDMEINPLRRVQRSLASTRVEEAIEAVLSLTKELLASSEGPCVGVAIGVPGPTDAQGKKVVFSESLGWSDVPLAQRLAAKIPYPVTVINRPRAGVLGEHWYGAGVGINDLIYVSISSGIGSGILIGGRLFTGASGYNGELGHTTVLVDGDECVCGNRGCLETVASVPAIARAIDLRLQAGERSILAEALRTQGQLRYQDIIAAVRDGDAVALDEAKRAGRFVGIAVANLIDLFNPSRVIIGGQLAEAGEIVINTIRQTAQRRTYPLSFADTQIVRGILGADAVCIGACALVVDRYIAEVELSL
jgi:glucokinase-like ROK family protein